MELVAPGLPGLLSVDEPAPPPPTVIATEAEEFATVKLPNDMPPAPPPPPTPAYLGDPDVSYFPSPPPPPPERIRKSIV